MPTATRPRLLPQGPWCPNLLTDTRPPPITGSDWLTWAAAIQTTAQAGLALSRDPYDQERYRALTRIGTRIVAQHDGATTAGAARIGVAPTEEDAGVGAERSRLGALFATAQAGPYAALKVGVRGAVFDRAGRVLLVRETVDAGRWTLPGGWAEVNQTPGESVVREIYEESGYHARPVKLAAVWDRARQPHPPAPYSVLRLFFVCTLEGGTPRPSIETSASGWFHEDAIPADLSLGRVLPTQIARMFAHWRDPRLPTEFE